MTCQAESLRISLSLFFVLGWVVSKTAIVLMWHSKKIPSLHSFKRPVPFLSHNMCDLIPSFIVSLVHKHDKQMKIIRFLQKHTYFVWAFRKMIKSSWAEDIAEKQTKITGFLKYVYLFCLGFMRGDLKSLNRGRA